ncbi:hypothetical protein [Vulcaniibacterium gelatinicum]|uniref:hypothetical protein n=1 Tax=Vulcaniibacterium gelatinicum TaxID=2598725 RepID=UPI0011C74B77|nr:hypothetical protein [Vulcaniibacterium gelatinicum]
MTAPRTRDPRPALRLPTPAPAAPAMRTYPERDFGVGYGRSSGYASERRYADGRGGPSYFRCR